jgi:cellulose synthase/poly-beta-1,6-N-acetylglucosamine synthase-like glycosyltransferase
MDMAEWIFWTSVFLVIYPYLGYPLLVFVGGLIWPSLVSRQPQQSAVTVLIPAYNEADCIAKTIQNKLDQNYPKDKLQIIVTSDGSTDGTDDIVRGFAAQGVEFLSRKTREGKAAALNEAVKHARGDIIIFSDANSLFDREAIRFMVENFADHEVGYVTGSLHLVTEDTAPSGSDGGVYLRYENFLRTLETRFASIIGVNGGVDAIRKSLYTEIPSALITDFVLPLRVIAQRFRVVYDPRVISHEVANRQLGTEFRMRVRVALRALQGLIYMRRLLNPIRYPVAAFCLISHKLLRYMTFLFLPIALAANIKLAFTEPLYQWMLAVHLTAYALALLGLLAGLPRSLRKITAVPSYFLLSNMAFSLAMLKFLRGEKMATWRPRAG